GRSFGIGARLGSAGEVHHFAAGVVGVMSEIVDAVERGAQGWRAATTPTGDVGQRGRPEGRQVAAHEEVVGVVVGHIAGERSWWHDEAGLAAVLPRRTTGVP